MSRFFSQGGSDSKDEDMEEVIQEVQNTDVNNRTISDLPLEILDHILSFLPTRVAARTPSLSKGWRDVFYRTPTLRIELNDETRDVIPFIRFVDRIVAVRRRDPTLHLRKFHLLLHKIIEDTHDENQARLLFQATNSWINLALEKRVTSLTLFFIELPSDYGGLPESIFVASFLVELKISTADQHLMCIASNVKVHLPSLKILSVDMVGFGHDGKGFYNLLEGCPVIEELEMKDILWFSWDSCYVSSSTLKILSIYWDTYTNEDDRDHRPESVSFVTPNLVYLNYNDDTAASYKDLDFASLVEAKVLLHLREENDKGEDEMEVEQEEDVSDFIDAICNVKKLFLHADTLQVLAFGCPTIPTFPNLTELIIESHHEYEYEDEDEDEDEDEYEYKYEAEDDDEDQDQDKLSDWDSLPILLNKCPELHTLVFLGLIHQAKNTCGNLCKCEGGLVAEASCLQASPVKVLKVYDFGQATKEMDHFVAMVNHFLVNMAHLEMFIVYCDGTDETRHDILIRIQGIQGKASPNCRNEVFYKKSS